MCLEVWRVEFIFSAHPMKDSYTNLECEMHLFRCFLYISFSVINNQEELLKVKP